VEATLIGDGERIVAMLNLLLRAFEVRRLEAAAALATAGPVVVEIANDPERRRAGGDMSEISGEVFERRDDEDKPAFCARLKVAATAAGEHVILISLATDCGLDDFRIDDLDQAKRIEEAMQDGVS
jgi:hypothetical protein